MKRTVSRVLVSVAAAAAFSGIAGGVADAAPAPAAQETPIWLLPGVDLGGLLEPTVNLPAQLLAPVFDVITFIAG
ncbi:hypothetical protein [Amycolatopsis nigrescens]|uniref:hypothetical protein n=1 Tax=Amycolatopsis nigrescens TaxID=381445 RepID=UPI00039E757F|nr:hypothetical protein [Amycolatopsis nigrescens]